MTTPRSRGTLVIDVENARAASCASPPARRTCWSCRATVNETGYRYPQLHDGCTGCTACQLVCPDFVFSVYRLHPAARVTGRRGPRRSGQFAELALIRKPVPRPRAGVGVAADVSDDRVGARCASR